MPKGKVITILHDRPAIEAALDALAQARTEPETLIPLQALAGYGMAALPVLASHLGTSDPWMVRALGRALSQLPDVDRAAESLRRAVLDPSSSDRRRIVAMVLLDQFLEQPLDEHLFSALGSPAKVATEALLRDTAPEERLARLDYLSILHVQEPEEISLALGRFGEVGSDPAIESLAFLAMDERENLAGAAVEQLGRIRRPAALHALRMLSPNVAAARRPAVERMQRKLLLGGVPDEPLPAWPAGARVLISPRDGTGNMLLLFLFPLGDGYRGLHVFLDDTRGIQGAYELDYAARELSRPGPIGTVCQAPHPWTEVVMLEGLLGYAQSLLSQALLRNAAEASLCPVEYRFFCPQVWGWSVPPDDPPAMPEAGRERPESIGALLETRYMGSWFMEGEAVFRAVPQLLLTDEARLAEGEMLDRAVSALVQAECSPEWCERYAGRLSDLLGWLVRAGEDHWAAVAQAALDDLGRAGRLSAFARAMARKGLLIALDTLRHRDQE